MEIVLAFLGSIFPAVLFNVKKERFFWIGLSGAFGWIAYDLTSSLLGKVVVATFIGALAVGFYSEIMARLLKAPAMVFSVSGIIPLVPGLGAYDTVQYIVRNELYLGIGKSIETIASAGSIALGIMLMSALFKVVSKFRKQKSLTKGIFNKKDSI